MATVGVFNSGNVLLRGLFVCAVSSFQEMAHDSIQTVNVSVCFCLVVFLYIFYCITVCVMGLEPATEMN